MAAFTGEVEGVVSALELDDDAVPGSGSKGEGSGGLQVGFFWLRCAGRSTGLAQLGFCWLGLAVAFLFFFKQNFFFFENCYRF